MTMHDSAWNEEEQRLHSVIQLIKTHIGEVGQLAEQRKETVVDTKRDFWTDITANMDNKDDIMETYSSITQQSMVLANQERGLRHAEDTLHQLLRLHDSPYFGRIDFKETDFNETEHIYIGISSFFDEATQQYWIYDWRAPISNLFYDYPPGPASYQTPSGRIEGTVELKRQYVIRQGEMKAMFDTGVAIGDEVLQQMLGQNADDKMKSIVATIQKEQNQIIRDDRHQVLIVQGAAGSGKTSVALQRVAYLLYKHRNTLNADNMVLFSPNALFNSYVSTVLPELGEANMQQTTYQEYLQHRLGDRFRIEDLYTQMEYMLTAEEDPSYPIRQSGIRFKSSNAFIRIMDSYARHLEQADMIFKDIMFRGKVLVSKQQMNCYFYNIDPSIKLSNRVQLLKEWLLKELKTLAKTERNEPWVKEAMELLNKEEYQKAFRAIQRKNTDQEQMFHDAKQEAFLLSRYIVHQRFQPLRNKIKQLQFINTTSLYKQLFQERGRSLLKSLETTKLPADWDAICRQTLTRLDNRQLAFEDATPMLYLNERIEGFQSYNTVRHVIIDEAQDYSAFQYTFLKRLFPRSKMTLLGDLNQAIYTHISETNRGNDHFQTANPSGYSHVLELFDAGRTEIIHLTRSYRSTREIVKFTKAMLPHGESIEPFNRSGEKPVVRSSPSMKSLTASVVADLQALQADGMPSIAILCKTAEESLQAYELLKPSTDVALITKDDYSFQKGVLLMPAYLAKGLEFDAVILWNASRNQYDRESERKLFYTACTRAMHRLHIFHTGELTRFISSLDVHTYEHLKT